MYNNKTFYIFMLTTCSHCEHESNHNLEKKRGSCVTGTLCSASEILTLQFQFIFQKAIYSSTFLLVTKAGNELRLLEFRYSVSEGFGGII